MSALTTGFPARRRFTLGEKAKQEIKAAFDLFDTELIGKLDVHELHTALQALGVACSKEEAKVALREYGRDEKLDFPDFLELITHKLAGVNPEEEAARTFEMFDEDGTGFISIKNLKKIARELSESVSEDDLRAMIEEFDRDNDGQISREEFIEVFAQTTLHGKVPSSDLR